MLLADNTFIFFCQFRAYQGRPTAARLAKSGLDYLANHPEERRILQELHILFIDKFVQVGAKLLSTISLLFQLLRENKCVWGCICARMW